MRRSRSVNGEVGPCELIDRGRFDSFLACATPFVRQVVVSEASGGRVWVKEGIDIYREPQKTRELKELLKDPDKRQLLAFTIERDAKADGPLRFAVKKQTVRQCPGPCTCRTEALTNPRVEPTWLYAYGIGEGQAAAGQGAEPGAVMPAGAGAGTGTAGGGGGGEGEGTGHGRAGEGERAADQAGRSLTMAWGGRGPALCGRWLIDRGFTCWAAACSGRIGRRW